MKTLKTIVCLLVVLSFTACIKENNGGLRLVAEGMGGAKMAIDGGASMWATGDEVWINGTEYNVTVDDQTGEGTASVTVGAPYHGIYPASLLADGTEKNLNGTTYTLNIPSEYTYKTVGGRQNLESPMVAFATDGQTLFFKHVTAAINVEIKNYHYDYDIAIDEIKVSSNNFQLCGEKEVDINNVEAIEPAAGDNSNNTVTIRFSNPLTVQTGNTVVVQVPVLPVGSNNKFTVKVSVHRADQPAMSATLSRAQTARHALSRAKMGYALFAFGGPFTVNANGKKVVFAKGNLQWSYNNGATHAVNGGGTASGTWRFAEHQYDIVGADNGNISATYSGWIDLFGWGTSGGNNMHPYMTSTNNSDYYNNTLLDITHDWGLYNAISNGGNEPNSWRTWTMPEMDYIINTRKASTINGIDNAKYAKATVADIGGLILFSDGYAHPYDVTLPTKIHSNSAEYTANNYTVEDWNKMELAGAIFLPATGNRSGTNYPNYTKSYGYYWSASRYNSTTAKYFYFANTSLSTTQYISKSTGCAVRLVKDVD